MSILELLDQQHREVVARMDDIRGSASDGDLEQFLAFLHDEVESHFRLEEEGLFPELQQIPWIANGPLRVMEVEHSTFRSMLSGADGAAAQADLANLRGRLLDIIGLLQSHIQKEDGMLFPMAFEALGPEQWERIERLPVMRTHAVPDGSLPAGR